MTNKTAFVQSILNLTEFLQEENIFNPSDYYSTLTCVNETKQVAFALDNVTFRKGAFEAYFTCEGFETRIENYVKSEALKDEQKMQMMKKFGEKLREACAAGV